MELVGFALIAAIVVLIAYYQYVQNKPKTYCHKCGGEMTADATKYRYTIEWTCQECGDTVEQLRNKN